MKTLAKFFVSIALVAVFIQVQTQSTPSAQADGEETNSLPGKNFLQCFWCRKKCTNETIRICDEEQNRCFHFLYNDGTIEKGCLIDTNWPTIQKARNKTHKGLRDSTYICGCKLCNKREV